jgi:RNA-directed DNA polymerase
MIYIRMLKAGVLSDGDLNITDEGVPQGNIVSPILSNIFAHYAFDRWFEEVIQSKTRMPVKCIRYFDDIVICCRYRSDAKNILKALRDRFQKVSLKLNVGKTKLVDFSQTSFRKGQKQETFDFLGFSFYHAWSIGGNVTVKLKTSRKRL